MNATLHSFIDIFSTEFSDGEDKIKLNKIEIPIIQRDYAQGRLDNDVSRVRNRFLSALYNAVVYEPITLDFVYGDIDSNGIMTPLDGQQRLTTLFLLHWYAAKKEGLHEEEFAFLHKFGYETRYSARHFCSELVKFTPSFENIISEEITNQAWFPLDWKKDPTVSSMLVVLDEIHEKFKDVADLWEKLKGNAITFYFLPIKDMGLTDELYIKMNSRGKPLTLFEHFKAELEREMRNYDEITGKNICEQISNSIDKTWTDLLWNYRNSDNNDEDDNIIDDEFLRYFKYVCDIICYQNGESPQSYSSDIFDLLQLYFSASNEKMYENIATLKAYFDCWCVIEGYTNPTEFLHSFMSHEHEAEKIIVDSKNKIDIFEDCLHSYGRKRHFSLGRIVLLYAITLYLQNQGEIKRNDFIRRIRIISNLIQNSGDEIRDSSDRNRMPAILKAVDVIMLKGVIDDSIEANFNMHQIEEEKAKMHFLEQHPELSETLFELEDNNMLRGQIGIVGLENINYAKRFTSLFTCDWDKIDCALMTVGNYGQQERNKRLYQYGSSSLQVAWDELFHKSSNMGFERTRTILIELLSFSDVFTNDLLDNIIDAYIKKCEKGQIYPWNYYYVKYKVFRPGSYGKLSNDNAEAEPYMYSVMQTRSYWSQNTYIPYLKEADDSHLSRDSMGQRLVYDDVYIVCENAAYIIKENESDNVVDTLKILQNDDGVDVENRIEKLKNYIETSLMPKT